jgi:Fe-S-cluster containining protein
VESLETELDRARHLAVAELADAIEAIGFECTRCGACCKAADPEGSGTDDGGNHPDGAVEEHTATVFPEEIRTIRESDDYDWRDVARPTPFGLTESSGGPEGETFEWALQTDSCGDCVFYEEQEPGETTAGDGGGTDDGDGSGKGVCTVHDDRPLICRTYPFSVALGGTSQPMGEAVDSDGMVRAHECEGLGRDISRADAEEMAATLKQRAVRELTEAIGVRDSYEPTAADGVVVHDSEGTKRPDGTRVGTDHGA